MATTPTRKRRGRGRMAEYRPQPPAAPGQPGPRREPVAPGHHQQRANPRDVVLQSRAVVRAFDALQAGREVGGRTQRRLQQAGVEGGQVTQKDREEALRRWRENARAAGDYTPEEVAKPGRPPRQPAIPAQPPSYGTAAPDARARREPDEQARRMRDEVENRRRRGRRRGRYIEG